MARLATIGNGNILIGLDGRGQVRDFYFPFVGEANHVSGASGNFVHRIGVHVDGVTSWFEDDAWEIVVAMKDGSGIATVSAIHRDLGVQIDSEDAVHNEQNIFIRHFTVTNLRDEVRTIKLILSQQFRIAESRRGDTGFFDPRVNAIIHYKGHTTLLINAAVRKQRFTEYNIGLFGIEGREGTYLDAIDGMLEKNPIEHGSVDSVLALTCHCEAQSSESAYYWIVCGASVAEAHTLDELVLEETPERLLRSTDAYWHAWLEKEQTDLGVFSSPLQALYRRSLVIMRVHADNRGGIIASADTDMLHHGRDTYSYVWPRDAAYVTHALDITGYHDAARRSYEFLAKCIEPNGYLMHKYRSDGVLGSSWHPWLIAGEPRLPIQEDETATVLFMLWEHYERHRDIEFIESLYNTFIEPAANFMCEYIDSVTGLPQPSFDLWEEKYGISTYTAASVYGALIAASKFAMTLGKDIVARTYQAVAQRMQTAIGAMLFDVDRGYFIKQITSDKEGNISCDYTLDASSLHGIIRFNVFDQDDERVVKTAAAIESRLKAHGPSAGIIRYEGDAYYRMSDASSPNPWIITTLWLAQYYIKRAQTLEDLRGPLKLLEWTESHAKGGVLAEQMHPITRAQLSTAPLVWSHAEFVVTVQSYLEKVVQLQSK